MSFDIFLQHFDVGVPTEAPKEGIVEALGTRKCSGPDEFGFYRVDLSNGIHVELGAKELETSGTFTGCAFFVREFNCEVAALIFDVARAGNMAVLPASSENIVAVTTAAVRENLPPDLLQNSKVILVRNPSELHALLQHGFEGWHSYLRDVKSSPLQQ